MTLQNIDIRPLATMQELAQMQRVEEAVWKTELLPLHQTFTSVKNGGIILGAYDKEKIVGFSYSFPGFLEGRVHLCSHMLGILPGYQQYGIGEKLKLKQAQLAREAGYPTIMWTFDPLESRNAYLNLHKLGATGAVYSANHYGDMADELNQGLPTDRIQIRWDIDALKQEQAYAFDPEKVLLDSREDAPVVTQSMEQVDHRDADVFFVAVPRDFQAIKQHDFERAKAWRMETRAVFERLFAQGFTATDFMSDEAHSASYYVFTR